ncbi:sugar ABC transporter permease [Phototrophicus methaneseepsis]|uniref:Sugar ABC transporter permease n=1 Tax=Phototrophicus methaneseepsis TaxID=2710758 RepID=A0A7S8IEH4_9CHLR|nr:sugar ABC transporter permease [Phototrophicus methaneseepsis]QPC83670.1 sugar ABC transporter permease [Phototrophicus methaneseepsis]
MAHNATESSQTHFPGNLLKNVTFKKSFRSQLVPYSFLMPSLLILAVFGFIPFVQGIYLAFTRYPLLQEPEFIGLANFERLTRDPIFLESLKNTFIYMLVTVPIRLIIGLMLALALNKAFPGRTLLRAIFYFPVVTPLIIAASLWLFLFNTHFGMINAVLEEFGLSSVSWLTSSSTAFLSVMIMSIWKTVGWNMVILLAGLQGIPNEIYEAAAVDGSNRWRTFWHITLPLLKPTILVSVVISTINASQVFEQVYVMTGGGPGYSTMTLVQLVYNTAFQQFDMGYASAISSVLFVIIMVITFINFKFFNEEVVY